MIPLALVTGFLGSGKTTLLKKIVEKYRDRKLVYLVNDFSPADIDGPLLGAATDDVVGISGGSIFCTCLVTTFIHHLKRVPEEWPDAEGVVVEASGVADPKVTNKMLAETKLDKIYNLASVITVVDPGSFMKLIHTLPNIIAQVEAADLALVNKTDKYTEDAIVATEAKIREIKRSAEIIRTVYCDVPLDIFKEREREEIHGDYAKCVNPKLRRYSVRPSEKFTVARLREILEEHVDSVYRLKGFMLDAGRPVYVDFASGKLKVEKFPSAADMGSTGEKSDSFQIALIIPAAAGDFGEKFAAEIKGG